MTLDLSLSCLKIEFNKFRNSMDFGKYLLGVTAIIGLSALTSNLTSRMVEDSVSNQYVHAQEVDRTDIPRYAKLLNQTFGKDGYFTLNAHESNPASINDINRGANLAGLTNISMPPTLKELEQISQAYTTQDANRNWILAHRFGHNLKYNQGKD